MFIITILASLVADRLTKIFAKRFLENSLSKQILGELLEFVYVENEGAAFNSFMGKKLFLLILTFLLMALLIFYYCKEKEKLPGIEIMSLALIAGGGLGNMIDRLYYGYVIDFINIHILPVFNIADCCICIGCGLMLLSVFVLNREDKKE